MNMSRVERAERVSDLPVSVSYDTCYGGRSVLIVVRSRLQMGTGQKHIYIRYTRYTQTCTDTHTRRQFISYEYRLHSTVPRYEYE